MPNNNPSATSGLNKAQKRFVLDTNAIVFLLKGNPSLLSILEQAEWIGISIISKIEFLAFQGLSDRDADLFGKFMSRVEVIGLIDDNGELIEDIINIRKQKRLKLPDAIILATALLHNCILVTADKDLLKIDGIETLSFDH